MAYELIWEQDGLIFSYSGIVTNEDAIHSNEQYYSDSRSDDIRFQIVDFTNAEKINIDEETVEYIGAMDCAQSKSSFESQKIAFVGNQDNLKTVMDVYSITLSSIGSDWKVGYFYDIESAKEWVLN